MKNQLFVSVIAFAISTVVVYCQETGGAAAGAKTPLVGLNNAFAGKFLIGTAGDVPRGYSESELANIKANYNIITPENSMKPQPTHPEEDRYNWATPDAMVQWCASNHIKVWGHTLAWHAQTARWFFQGTNGEPVTREVAMERLKNHILTEVGRYKGRVYGWDVVNEAINDSGGGTTENLRNSSWLRAIGPDYITMAFKWAHEADPQALLFYNDYNIDSDTNLDLGSAQYTGKHASSMLLLKRLLKDGAPINGVGIQGHWHLYTSTPDVEKAIADYASLGLKVSISELDVTATGSNSGAFPGGGGGGEPISAEAFQQQARVYAKLFDVFNRHANAMSRVTFWGISDRRSWRSGQRPLVFDAQLQPKPALFAILDVAQGKYAPKQ
ncbi:MAG TPA: endo-1,4-beta-xylanase [Verrucomicrobiae bacterium]|nr:endo-1,4-beta-xylanase [Verrucomicrobiae bacterium]